jgi:hypothetical protein
MVGHGDSHGDAAGAAQPGPARFRVGARRGGQGSRAPPSRGKLGATAAEALAMLLTMLPGLPLALASRLRRKAGQATAGRLCTAVPDRSAPYPPAAAGWKPPRSRVNFGEG